MMNNYDTTALRWFTWRVRSAISAPSLFRAGNFNSGREHQRENRLLNRRRMFTLLELLLVLVILTALAGVVVPRFAQRGEQARITAALSDIASLEIALDAFEIDTGRYPTNDEGLRALIERPGDVRQWNGPYIRRGVPRDPWGNPYNYRQPGLHNPNSYDLWSYGSDGQDGTDDDIDNWSER